MKERETRKGGGRSDGEKSKKPVVTARYEVKRSAPLLEFLLDKCKTSRNNVKRLLADRKVLVNGSTVTQYDFLLAREDEVKIVKSPVSGGQPTQRRAPSGRDFNAPRGEWKILYEDEDFIAVDKPAGLLSVENDKGEACAFDFVLSYLRQRDKKLRPYVLHRIDKETSGVLVFAKNVVVHSMLRLDWNEYVREREYYAVVEGMPEKKEGTIVSYLKESKNNIVYSTHDPSGQKAITHYAVVREGTQFALLRVKIDTGRKNQIRVQLSAQGNPVTGDKKYGAKKDPLRRLGLHASRLAFVHPVKKTLIEISSPVPPVFYSLF